MTAHPFAEPAVLRAARAAAGLSRPDLAAGAGVSERTIARLETGAGNRPLPAVAAGLERALAARGVRAEAADEGGWRVVITALPLPAPRGG